jgi:hypothetical protein
MPHYFSVANQNKKIPNNSGFSLFVASRGIALHPSFDVPTAHASLLPQSLGFQKREAVRLIEIPVRLYKKL